MLDFLDDAVQKLTLPDQRKDDERQHIQAKDAIQIYILTTYVVGPIDPPVWSFLGGLLGLKMYSEIH